MTARAINQSINQSIDQSIDHSTRSINHLSVASLSYCQPAKSTDRRIVQHLRHSKNIASAPPGSSDCSFTSVTVHTCAFSLRSKTGFLFYRLTSLITLLQTHFSNLPSTVPLLSAPLHCPPDFLIVPLASSVSVLHPAPTCSISRAPRKFSSKYGSLCTRGSPL